MIDENPNLEPTAESIFHDALDRDPDTRTAFVRDACVDGAMYAEVNSLLAAFDAADDSEAFMRSPVGQLGADALESAIDGHDVVGTVIGGFRVDRQLASGGMGSVYLATSTAGDYEQRVAIKLIKRGMDTDDVLRRFRLERQLLARLEHPNIARLIHGGATERGRPFFVMEFIDGAPITEFCDRQGSAVRDRLDLFTQVCDAVQSAHQQLVVHRDLKPSNILVGSDGTVKLLDFGIAKLLDQDGPDQTRTDQRPLTPRYASPEQRRGEGVSTATDVFSLGVVLYELLIGVHPFPDSTEDTTTPTRPSALTGTDAGAARNRGTTIGGLRRELRGDLDTIVLKSLAEDPHHRYGSAGALRDDLARAMRGLPIEARLPTLAYRVSTFVRRNRLLVGSMVLVLIALAVGTAIGIHGLLAAQRAEIESLRQRNVAVAVNQFLQRDVLGAGNPTVTLEEASQFRAGLDRAAQRVEGRFEDLPEIEGAIRRTIGATYLSVSELEEAERHLERARVLLEGLDTGDHAELGRVRADLATLRSTQSRYDEADDHFAAAIELLSDSLGPDDPETIRVAARQAEFWTRKTGRYDEAHEIFDRVLPQQVTLLGRRDADVLRTMRDFGFLLSLRGDDDEAERMLTEALALQTEELGVDHPTTLLIAYQLGRHETKTGQIEHAVARLGPTLEAQTRILGELHHDTLNTLSQFAATMRPHDIETSIALYRRAVELRGLTMGADHPRTLSSMSGLAMALASTDELEEARRLHETVATLAPTRLPPGHAYIAAYLRRYARILRDLDMLDEAEPVVLQAIDAATPPNGLRWREQRRAIDEARRLYRDMGRTEESQRYADRLADMRRLEEAGKALGPP